jgi:hypothetical protein
MLPALRATKSSPSLRSANTSSGGTRLSEHVSIVAHGVCAWAICSRCLERSTAHNYGASLAYFSFGAFTRAIASFAVTFVEAPAANAGARPNTAVATMLVAAKERN